MSDSSAPDGDPAAADESESDRGATEGSGIPQAVLEYLARQIVDAPERVTVDSEPGRRGPRLSLRVDPEDMGKVIGRRGRMAQAIRTVVRASGARHGLEVSVDIVD
jgi:predicted RNA-binding protein YlqC (UPF0109 family)